MTPLDNSAGALAAAMAATLVVAVLATWLLAARHWKARVLQAETALATAQTSCEQAGIALSAAQRATDIQIVKYRELGSALITTQLFIEQLEETLEI